MSKRLIFAPIADRDRSTEKGWKERPDFGADSKVGRVEFDASHRTDYFVRTSSTADKLEQEIKSLPDIEKLLLVDAILADLDRPNPEIDPFNMRATERSFGIPLSDTHLEQAIEAARSVSFAPFWFVSSSSLLATKTTTTSPGSSPRGSASLPLTR